MEKLIGRNLNISIFISGRGSNLLSLIKYSKHKNSKVKINLIISNNKFSKGLEFAKKNKIKYHVINYSKKKQAENKILRYLRKNKIDLICLAGFMKILSSNFIRKFKNPILNIHPSILPRYKGLNTHMKAIKNKDTGETKSFFNLGPKNKWQEKLDIEIKQSIEEKFEIEMRELGYL